MANKAAATQAGALTGIGGVGSGGGGFVNPATRTARRLYVGNLPPTTDQALVRRAVTEGGQTGYVLTSPFHNPLQLAFFNELIASVYKPGEHLVGVFVHGDRRFAFAEFKEANVAAAAVALDGVFFNGAQLRIKRPNDYVPAPPEVRGRWREGGRQELQGDPHPPLLPHCSSLARPSPSASRGAAPASSRAASRTGPTR